ncbi:hypothetical protein [Actinomadura kijaniata]|uniref:hypothetical protein n=1 Tax=Actinomadura kijaniata TaxID=46161 RepID=UPI0012F737C0|nr:hypothetical protein [Actinomadura kijaniata]
MSHAELVTVKFWWESLPDDRAAEVVCSHCHAPLRVEDVAPRPGPGYPDGLLSRPDVRDRFGLDAPPDDRTA